MCYICRDGSVVRISRGLRTINCESHRVGRSSSGLALVGPVNFKIMWCIGYIRTKEGYLSKIADRSRLIYG